MNRTALGLALGAGYLLGRTRKLKMAMAVGSVVAGKKLNLTPRGVAQLVNQQLRDNPQFKEIGDQLRQDLQGVGKAASGALVERQMTALADRLHSRTEQVRGQVSGAVPGTGSEDEEQETGGDEDRGESREDSADRERDTGESGEDADEGGEDEQRRERPAKKAAQKNASGGKDGERGSAARKPAAKKTAKKTGAARKTAAKQTAGAGGAARGRSRSAKGGDDR